MQEQDKTLELLLAQQQELLGKISKLEGLFPELRLGVKKFDAETYVMSVKEAAFFLRTNTKAIYNWVSSGELTPLDYGDKKFRFIVADLQRFADSKKI